MDWSEPYLKLEQSHKSLKDALNQERYEDAEELLFSIMASTDALMKFVISKIESNGKLSFLRGSNINATMYHDAGAYARCCFCGRYSDHAAALAKDYWPCDCGKSTGWSGSFERPTHNATWSESIG